MKIRMVETYKGSEDGHIVRQYDKGEIYEVRQWLARHFFERKVAVLVNEGLQKLYTNEVITAEF